ncbi:hypothetical protein BHE74_00031121 [Ensete ventricosum]|uniref:Uncharacterized protein n=1 Tax=Ensete ventricosum TaxID=4639 RepID=A0A427AZK4_ENSVE|nr:hypothetical protein B296_00003917 [Ensete ventricosum]RWW08561.1 hypothetical protein GW17_00027985 [Ensete ventricosum]RWW61796.1 hypothetical protein BHE74_00031121 [Ensete ventricosum]RZR72871.1 hypothetical protein BHM03_00018097 [Ensete ventricosum]
MAAFRRLAESTHFAGFRSSSQIAYRIDDLSLISSLSSSFPCSSIQKEASTAPSNQISRRGYHIDLGAREKAVGPSSLSDSLSGDLFSFFYF